MLEFKIVNENVYLLKGTDEKKKEKIPGVIYLSRIPTKMNVKLIRDYFGNFGTVDRVFLEPRGFSLL